MLLLASRVIAKVIVACPEAFCSPPPTPFGSLAARRLAVKTTVSAVATWADLMPTFSVRQRREDTVGTAKWRELEKKYLMLT